MSIDHKESQAIIQLAGQEIMCSVISSKSKAHTYEGYFTVPIIDKFAFQFWCEFEDSVNSMLLTHIDELEAKLSKLPYFVTFNGQKLHAAKVDLQIFPSLGVL